MPTALNLLLLIALLSEKTSGFEGLTGHGSKGPMKCPHLQKKAEYHCPYSNRYQRIDGMCNNHVAYDAGAVSTPFRRVLPPDYGDGVQSLRLARDGGALPNARVISNAFMTAGVDRVESQEHSHMFVQVGQFLAHDTTKTVPSKENDQSEITCECDSERPECFKISVPEMDVYYKGKRECIPMVRSAAQPGTSCSGKPRQQLNSISAYWDGNTMYGPTEAFTEALRDQKSEYGEMLYRKSSLGPRADSLPLLGQIPAQLRAGYACPKHLHGDKDTCFAGGEARTNENQGLICMHTIFLREHNRIARGLKAVNPHWTANTTFWEARKIMGAITQQITYREFLPALVGAKNMEHYELSTLDNGFYYGYDATYDASISNVWATAAFRYGHSMIKKNTSHLHSNYEPERPPTPAHEALFNPSHLQNVSANRDPFLIRGLLDDAAEKADSFMNEELRSKMFESDTKIGVDLLAINLERGRDHGLPGYNKWREYCGLKRAVSFDDLTAEIVPAKVEILSNLYRNVDDIDLYIGALAETHVKDAAVGPTFACLNAEQFRALKKGDTAWFENPETFSYDQLQEIRKVSLSGIICNNVVGMETIQPNVMYLDSVPGNARSDCFSVPNMDFSAWKSRSPTHGPGVFTRWFPKSDNQTGLDALHMELTRHSDQVCRGPSSFEKENLDNSFQRIRFMCPYGSIAVSDFPKSVAGHTWTHWFDRDTQLNGDDSESLSRLLIERPQDVCPEPLFMQARTLSMVPALETKETFEYYGPLHGLICKGHHQPSGMCSDYAVRFLCPNEFFEAQKKHHFETARRPDVEWTKWMQADDAKGKGDIESPALSRFIGLPVCRTPILIEARIVGTRIPVEDTNDVLKKYSPLYGLHCLNGDQPSGQCHEYEVRYLCPK